MNFQDVLNIRQSTRRFTEEQISEEQLQMLLKAANQAPIGSAMYQDIHITVVQNQEILLHLCEAAWERFSSKEKVEEVAGDVAKKTPGMDEKKPNLFYHAPTVIFVSHRRQTLQPGLEYANVSTVINQMHLSAIDMGLGSCYMWGALESMRMIPELDHTDDLKLPEDFEPLMALAVGYPKDPLEKKVVLPEIGLNRIKKESFFAEKETFE